MSRDGSNGDERRRREGQGNRTASDRTDAWQLVPHLGGSEVGLPVSECLPIWLARDLATQGLQSAVLVACAASGDKIVDCHPAKLGLALVNASVEPGILRALQAGTGKQFQDVQYLAIVTRQSVGAPESLGPTLGPNHVLVSAHFAAINLPWAQNAVGPVCVWVYANINDIGEHASRLSRAVRANADILAPATRHAMNFRDVGPLDQPEHVVDRIARQSRDFAQRFDAERTRAGQLRIALHHVLESSVWKRTEWLRKVTAKVRNQTYVPWTLPPSMAEDLAGERSAALSAGSSVFGADKDKRPLIVMVLETFDVGGLEQVVLDLSLRLTDRGSRLAILVVLHGGRLADQARKAGLPVHVLNGDISALNQKIMELQPALAVCHHSFAGHDAFSRTGTPIVEVLHNIYHWHKGNRQIAAARKLTKRFAACSSSVQKYAVDFLDVPPEKITLIQNGIDPQGFVRPHVNVLREQRRASADTNFVMTSHIWANKSHHALLTAFEHVHARHPRTRLFLCGAVGHADVADALHRRIKAAGLESVVEIRNVTDRGTMSGYYSSAHAFVLPSIVEGFSISTLEASFFGVPLILSDTGGARDLLEVSDGRPMSGLIIDPPIAAGDVTPEAIDRVGRMERPMQLDDLVQAMMSIVDQRDDWIERGIVGIERVERFHIERTVDKYLDLFSDVVRPAAAAIPSA